MLPKYLDIKKAVTEIKAGKIDVKQEKFEYSYYGLSARIASTKLIINVGSEVVIVAPVGGNML